MEDIEVDPYSDDPLPELEDIREGEELDWTRIATYLRKEMPSEVDLSGNLRVLQFPHGSANLTYLIAFGDTELVFRRPPFGVLAPGAHDMRREHQVLSRLWRNFDLAPRSYLFCDDHSIGGADFIVVERRTGEVIRGVMPPSMRHHDRIGYRVGMALVGAMATFHTIDPATADLTDLGKPEGFVERQVAGWKKRWDLVADPIYNRQMCELHEELERRIPKAQRVSLVHNDLKLDNCMFDPANPDQVIAIFDWDMTTLGDPLVDLGTMLNYWPDPSDDETNRGHAHPGMEKMGLPTRAEVMDKYGDVSGLDVSQAHWYAAFAQWKTGVVVQQLHHRWKVGDSTDERMAIVAESLPRLIKGASRYLSF